MTEEISSVTTRIVDLPIRRPHRIGPMEMRGQSCVVVQVRTADGLTGLGEGVVPGGGPGWGGESVESIKVTIDAHLGPALCAGRVRGVNEAVRRMQAVSAANHFAKAAIEMAMWDIAGKRLGQPVHQLLGGLQRDAIDVLWSLGANTPELFGEAEQFIAEGHKTIKFMMGGRSPQAEVERITAVLEKLPEGLTYTIDANGKWDEASARRWLPVLAGAGIGIAEQLVPAWNLEAMARLTGATRAWVMADESVCTLSGAVAVAQLHAADVIAVKVPKLGGIAAARDVAAVARGAGLHCYAGGTMETSIGTSAAAQVFGTVPELVGSDLIGPIMRTEDIVTEPLVIRNGQLPVPDGPGLGVELDEDAMRRFARALRPKGVAPLGGPARTPTSTRPTLARRRPVSQAGQGTSRRLPPVDRADPGGPERTGSPLPGSARVLVAGELAAPGGVLAGLVGLLVGELDVEPSRGSAVPVVLARLDEDAVAP